MANVANIPVSKRYNVKSSVLIGILSAENRRPWGTTKADNMLREYIVGLTRNGFIVYDFRTGKVISGKEFQNRDYIKGIIF